MADIVNLRQARKAKARAEQAALAAENRRKFGRPKPERDAQVAQERLDRRCLGGHRLSSGDAE
jgi:hypothetical protein